MKLKFKTNFENLQTAYIIGEFCDWDLDKAMKVTKIKNAKFFTVEDMPVGEYKILTCLSWIGTEICPISKKTIINRYFNGMIDETVFANYKI